MSYLGKSGVEKRAFDAIDEVEICVREIEEFSKIFFGNENLKLGFRVYNGTRTVSLSDYLANSDEGEFKIYLVKGDIDTFNELVDHDIYKDKIFLGGFCLNQMPGCCGIAVLYHTFITVDYRGNGFGQYLTKLQKLIAKARGFTMLLCTDRISNTPQRVIMEKFEFTSYFTFKNSKTNNLVELRASDLTKEIPIEIKCKKDSTSQKFENIRNSVRKIFSTTSIK